MYIYDVFPIQKHGQFQGSRVSSAECAGFVGAQNNMFCIPRADNTEKNTILDYEEHRNL